MTASPSTGGATIRLRPKVLPVAKTLRDQIAENAKTYGMTTSELLARTPSAARPVDSQLRREFARLEVAIHDLRTGLTAALESATREQESQLEAALGEIREGLAELHAGQTRLASVPTEPVPISAAAAPEADRSAEVLARIDQLARQVQSYANRPAPTAVAAPTNAGSATSPAPATPKSSLPKERVAIDDVQGMLDRLLS